MLKRDAACTRATRSSRAFTLAELLIVVAIIALLMSILLPSLNSARESAKQTGCLSNERTIGLALMQYCASNRAYFPSAYYYVNGATSAAGYIHWSGILEEQKYMGGKNAFVCPSHKVKGWAPTNFTPARIPEAPAGQTALNPAVDDHQAKRITYVPNEALMPRKKLAVMPKVVLVGNDEVENAQNTILLAEYADIINQLADSSPSGGDAIKSHRPTNGIKEGATDVFDAETGYATGDPIHALTAAEAWTAINAARAASAVGNHHICYINPDAHRDMANYVFADGHASTYTLEETLSPKEYMWGRTMYSLSDKPVVKKSDGSGPINDGSDSQNNN